MQSITDVKIGKLYQSQDYYLLMWPEINLALQAINVQTGEHDASVAARSWTSITGGSNNNDDENDFATILANGLKAGLRAEIEATESVARWTKKLGHKPVCVKPYEIFMVVDYLHVVHRNFYKIILGNQIGWLIWYNYIRFYEAR